MVVKAAAHNIIADIEGRGNQKSTTFGSDRYHHEELPFPQIRGHLMLRLVCNPLRR